MSEPTQMKKWLANNLKSVGLRGRGSVWRIKGDEVQWVVQIVKPPYGNYFGLDIGLDLQVASTPTGPTDCPILIHLENMPLGQRDLVLVALDLKHDLSDTERQQQVSTVIRELGTYLKSRLSLEQVRNGYAAGEFSSALIRRDARAVLESTNND